MIITENNCVGCETCIGCGLSHQTREVCDLCKKEDPLFFFDGNVICRECLYRIFADKIIAMTVSELAEYVEQIKFAQRGDEDLFFFEDDPDPITAAELKLNILDVFGEYDDEVLQLFGEDIRPIY